MIDEGKKIYDGSLSQLKDTYGTNRKVSMEVKNPAALSSFKLDNCETFMDMSNNVFTVTFDKHKVQVPQIMNAVMELTDVKDIQIQETELAEIVKAIYKEGV